MSPASFHPAWSPQRGSLRLRVEREYVAVRGESSSWVRLPFRAVVWEYDGHSLTMFSPDVPRGYEPGLLMPFVDGVPVDLATFNHALRVELNQSLAAVEAAISVRRFLRAFPPTRPA